MRVRTFQVSRDVKRFGKRKCPWSIEWHDPATGRKLCRTIGTKKLAQDAADAKQAELVQRRYGMTSDKPWGEFVDEYKREYIDSRMTSERSREEARRVLDRFTTAMQPKHVNSVDEQLLDQYVTKRTKERGVKKGDTVSAATVRKDLRTLRAALGQAKRWKYIADVPAMPKVKGIDTEKRYVTAEHFDAMLQALDAEKCPVSFPFGPDSGGEWTASDWWTALLVFLWVTGMRIGAVLKLQWEDVDLDAGLATSRGQDNKGRRCHTAKIGPVVPLLRKIKGDSPYVFPWPHAKTWLASQYLSLQKAAGISLPCVGSSEHECTDHCRAYCFHDFRRAHATYNFGRVDDRALQQQMGHASFSTTRSYVRYGEEHRQAAYDVHLPKLAKAKAQGLRVTGQSESPDGGQAADNRQKQPVTGESSKSVSA